MGEACSTYGVDEKRAKNFDLEARREETTRKTEA
jgi:hypothetical protein